MPFLLWEGDLTTYAADAVVNAANRSLLGGGGVDGAIHRAAGPELFEECLTLGGCETGKAKKTKGYRMPCKYIIHTVGPVWIDGRHGEPELLASCYRESLRLAKESGCESVAFPLISSGAYGYPRAEAWRVARETIETFLSENDPDMTVTMVVLNRKDLWTDSGEKNALADWLTRGDETPDLLGAAAPYPLCSMIEDRKADAFLVHRKANARLSRMEEVSACCEDADLEERLRSRDESFTEMLLRKIDESGMTDAQCYRLANVDRKLFSKIRSDRFYRPSKQTALAFAFALRLSGEDVRDLLRKAGFALSDSTTFDLIIGYFLEKGEYDLMTVNEALFAYDQPLLGR